MERASLRPVPLRPLGPVDPEAAAGHVAAALPELEDDARRALALVELVGRPRESAADELGLEADGVAEALARARKALRRSMFPLSSSGWCERAERLISDRLDGELAAPGPARLAVHLANCDRCVEHERRLAQARDSLVRDFIERHPAHDVTPPAEEPPIEEVEEPEPAPALRVVEPGTEDQAEVERRPAAAVAAPVPTAKAPATDEGAAVAKRTLAGGAAKLAWGFLFALAVILAVATVVITVLAATGTI